MQQISLKRQVEPACRVGIARRRARAGVARSLQVLLPPMIAREPPRQWARRPSAPLKGEAVATESEERPEDWIVSEPQDGIVRVTHTPSRETFEITVADVRGATPGDDAVWDGHLDDYLTKRAINIAAHRKLARLAQ